MKDNHIHRKVINYMYQSMGKIMAQLPFSGQHWLEQFVLGVAQYLLDEYTDKLHFTSQDPIVICQEYTNFLDQEGFLDAKDYIFEKSGNDLLVHVNRDNCIYRQYSLHTLRAGLPLQCVRLSAFQAVLRQVIDKDYSTSVKIDQENGICHGVLFPSTKPKEEIVTREEHKLKIAGRRAILLPQETYASLLLSVREHAPHALKHVLYDAGYRSGSYLAHKAKALYPDINECLQLLLEEITNEGLGRVEVVSLDLACTRAKIRCYDSFQVDITKDYGSLYRTPQVICDLIRGIFAAYFSVLFEKEIICEEMTCQSIGGNYCEFLVLPLPQEFGKRGEIL